MGLFDKLRSKKEKLQILDKPLEEMTEEEFLSAYQNADTYSDYALFYRYNREKHRRGLSIGSLWKLGYMAFWGEYAGTKVDVDLNLAEACARALLQDSSDAKRNIYKYVLGYFSSDNNKPSYCFTPNFDALEKALPLIVNMERKRYRKTKREYTKEGRGVPDFGYEQALILDEIRNLRRVGYDKIEHTPNNVVSFFRELAEKGDPTGQYWFAMCYDYQYIEGFEPTNAAKWLIKSAEQGYLLAVYDCDSASHKRFSESPKYEQLKKEHNELVQLMDEYIETVVCTYPMESFSHFMAKKNAAFAEVAQKEANVTKANNLYQQGLAFFALGEQDKTRAAMLEAAGLGNLSAYEWMVKLSAEEGNALAQYQLGELYLLGTELTPKNPTMAFPWLAKAANGGIMDAYWRMGELYRVGVHGFDRNEEMAAAMYRKAAEGNHKPSMLCYGVYCKPEEAKEVYRNLIKICSDSTEDKAYKLEAYRRLSIVDPSDGETSILAAAQFLLLYFDSTKKMDYTGKTPEEAVKAVFAGNADTARDIGTAVKHKTNVVDAEKMACVWWSLAADMYMEHAVHGDVEAIKQLYYIYIDHLKDDGKAYYWGMKGLETGDAAMYYEVANHPSLFNLDHEEIIAYLNIAAQKGYAAANEDLIWWRNQERNERERQRKVQRILGEQEAQRRSQKEWALNTRLDDLERMSNALVYGDIFTDEERALMGKISVMDSIRSANLRNEVMKSLMKKK